MFTTRLRLRSSLGALAVLAAVLPLLTVASPTLSMAEPAQAAAKAPTRVSGWGAGRLRTQAGEVVRLHVKVRPATATQARRVVLQQRSKSRRGWTTVRAARTDRHGVAKLRWRMSRTTTQLRVVVPATARARGLVSRARAVPAPLTLSEFEAEVLRLSNQARGKARTCGGQHYGAVGSLAHDASLTAAGRAHARDMGTHDFFAHDNLKGQDPTDRAKAAGYAYGAGENIAAGFTTPEAVVQAWLDSAGHCANLMRPHYLHIGVSHVHVDGSTYGDYWVQMFGVGR